MHKWKKKQVCKKLIKMIWNDNLCFMLLKSSCAAHFRICISSVGRITRMSRLVDGERAEVCTKNMILPDCSYESALVSCGLSTLLVRREDACRRFISNIKESGFLTHLLPQPTNVAHGYGLRSGFSCSEFRFVRTDRLSKFLTHTYNRA